MISMRSTISITSDMSRVSAVLYVAVLQNGTPVPVAVEVVKLNVKESSPTLAMHLVGVTPAQILFASTRCTPKEDDQM